MSLAQKVKIWGRGQVLKKKRGKRKQKTEVKQKYIILPCPLSLCASLQYSDLNGRKWFCAVWSPEMPLALQSWPHTPGHNLLSLKCSLFYAQDHWIFLVGRDPQSLPSPTPKWMVFLVIKPTILVLPASCSNQLLFFCVAFNLESFNHKPKILFFLCLCDRIRDEYFVFNACSSMHRNKKTDCYHSSKPATFPFGVMEYKENKNIKEKDLNPNTSILSVY